MCPSQAGCSLQWTSIAFVQGTHPTSVSQRASHRCCVIFTDGVQVAILAAQVKYGPRWFIPKRFLPAKYDYFQRATLRSVAAAGGTDLSPGDIETGDAGAECVICMTPVDTERHRTRMVTPCGHFFHPTCLQRWMDVKMECPTCRRMLPPL